jgi:glycosyltransferase involved in cell wall biosynthesis
VSRKKICIDGFNIAMPRGSGIATYARNLNHALRDLGHETQILYGPPQGHSKIPLLNEIALVNAWAPPTKQWSKLGSYLRKTLPPFGRTVRRVSRTGFVDTRQVERQVPPCDVVWTGRDLFHGANSVFNNFGVYTPVRFARADGVRPDVMHWTCPLPIKAKGLPNLYTIHDLVPLKLPFSTLDNKRRFYRMCRWQCWMADRIVTVSQKSAEDIMEVFGVDPSRIAVTYQAVDVPQRLLAQTDEEVARSIEGAFGLGWRGYFIYFGAIEPKKNLARIIEAYLASGVEAPLVIIGGRAWLDEEETRLLYEDLVEVTAIKDGVLRRTDRIRRYDYLPFSTLIHLIRGARATLLPSLYEGFGLPVLESMLLRTPVLTSKTGSLPEVAGDAALLADPYDAAAIKAAIRALDADEGLRSELIDKGVRQAAKFSPDAYRARLAELYGQAG